MSWWPFGRKSGGVVPDVLVAPVPLDLVERLQAECRDHYAARIEDAREIERLRKGLTPPRDMIPMGDGGRSAYGLVAKLVEALNHLSTLQQAAHLMSEDDVETHEIILVNAACDIYMALTGVRVSSIETMKKMDAKKASGNGSV
jgi:hypothetical protein